MNEKKCFNCKQVKSTLLFYKNKSKKDGFYSSCKQCTISRFPSFPKSKELKIVFEDNMKSNEIWTSVYVDGENFDKYKISNYGRIMLSNGNIAKNSFDRFGYPQIVLCGNNKRISRRLHVLVAQNFIGERKKGTVVNHIDGNKLNCFVGNLEYTTYKSNSIHSAIMLPGISRKKMILDKLTGIFYYSIKEFSVSINLNEFVAKKLVISNRRYDFV